MDLITNDFGGQVDDLDIADSIVLNRLVYLGVVIDSLGEICQRHFKRHTCVRV